MLKTKEEGRQECLLPCLFILKDGEDETSLGSREVDRLNAALLEQSMQDDEPHIGPHRVNPTLGSSLCGYL